MGTDEKQLKLARLALKQLGVSQVPGNLDHACQLLDHSRPMLNGKSWHAVDFYPVELRFISSLLQMANTAQRVEQLSLRFRMLLDDFARLGAVVVQGGTRAYFLAFNIEEWIASRGAMTLNLGDVTHMHIHPVIEGS